MRKGILYLTAFTVLSIFITACGMSSAVEKGTDAGRAPDFTLRDLNGKEVSLSEFIGKKAILLDFTTTWCPPCVAIIPTMKEIYAGYKDRGLEVLAVYLSESRENIERFAQKHQLTYTVLVDEDGFVGNKYGIIGVPTVMIVGKDGMIKYAGHRISKDVIEEALN